MIKLLRQTSVHFPWIINPPFLLHTLGPFFPGRTARISQLAALEPDYQSPTMRSFKDFDCHDYASLIHQCVFNYDLTKGQAFHCEILKKGNCLDLFARNVFLNFYVKFGLLSDALKVFDEMPERNIVSFVTLIQGLGKAGRFNDAIGFFSMIHKEGHELNPFVFTTVLKLFVNMGRADLCWNVHACIYKMGLHSNAFVGTALIDSYCVCGDVDVARDVFDEVLCKDMVAWSGMLAGYAENGWFEEALRVFSEMQVVGFMPNNYTLASGLKACVGLGEVCFGKSIHGCALKMGYVKDNYVGIALLDLYTKIGDFREAEVVFKDLPEKDVIPWSFMIARCAQTDQSSLALDIFSQMRQACVMPNQFTLASVLQASASMANLNLGKQTHCIVVKVGLHSNVFVSNALMDVYAKCGRVEDSLVLFEASAIKNDVTWNTMIVGHGQVGNSEKALMIFKCMLEHNVLPTEVSYSSTLRACASLAAADHGMQIHALTVKTKLDKDSVVGNSLIDMYAKCGNIKPARLVFDKMEMRDEVSWNSIISAYAMHGLGKESLRMFERMLVTNCKPNKLTFVSVLSACSNMGLLNEGQSYFTSMIEKYGIEPCIEHYTCMVWLLGRSGNLDKAMKLITDMPFEPSVMIWRAVLGACVIHKNAELGKVAAEHVLELEPHDETAYVLLSNIYASLKRWGHVAHVRKSMKKKGVKKEPGLSWVEIQCDVHYFSVGDTSHPDSRLIKGMLEWLKIRIDREGYIANCNVVLLDVEDEEKERIVWSHSERLALAFALVRTPLGSPVRILKNLRICADCHVIFKLISKVVQREIVVRDINRFHHFEDGSCSCDDYW